MKAEIVKKVQMECGEAYVIRLKDGNLLEMGDVYLPNEDKHGTRPFRYRDFGQVSDADKRVMTICTMAGCFFNCQFCSVRRTFKRHLTAEELVGQVEFLIEEGIKNGRSKDPIESREFNVLYTRMGEPSANSAAVIGSIYKLVERWPNVKIGMSSCGWKKGVTEFLKHPGIAKHIMMQFSTHGTDEATRSRLLGLPTGKVLMTLEEIADFVKKFRKLNTRMVSLNIILFRGIKYNFQRLRTLFSPEDVYLRLSPLNMTNNASKKGLVGLLTDEDVLHKAPYSSPELEKVISEIESCGFTYAYAPAIDEEIKYQAACGQALEMVKKEKPSDPFFTLRETREKVLEDKELLQIH